MMILLACAFLLCAFVVFTVKRKYIVNDRLNREAVNNYTTQSEETGEKDGATKREIVLAPIKVDFKALKEINSDIIGWIYCEDTPLNFPLVQTTSNSFYIDHGWDGKYNPCGAAFADAVNKRDFADSNTIIYGHHLYDGSMFASLEEWQEQEYFDEHPIMWILTPERDYRVELFSAYFISAYDEVYTVYPEPSEQFNEYLQKVRDLSVVTADVELDGELKYVMLSTCAYVFANARAIIHGMMVPVDSIGGVFAPLE